jgi:hypothetical protein
MVDGDWEPCAPHPEQARGAAAASLAAVAMLPMTSLLLEHGAGASSALAAATASLPVLALLLVAVTWRPAGGRP